MKLLFRKCRFGILFILAFCVISAMKPVNVQAAKYHLDYSLRALKVGDEQSNWLSKNDGSTLKKSLKWTSSNSKIAKIVYAGKGYATCTIKALKPGICTISTKYKGKKYKYKVVVYKKNKKTVKKLKIDMQGLAVNKYSGSDYCNYSYGCRIYNPNNFAVTTTLNQKVLTAGGTKVKKCTDSFKIPAKGYKYFADYGNSASKPAKVVYTFKTKKPTPTDVSYFDVPLNKKMQISELRIQKKPDYTNSYNVSWKVKNLTKDTLSDSSFGIYFIKNNRVIDYRWFNNPYNMKPKETFVNTSYFIWYGDKWDRVIVVYEHAYTD